jgi:DNA topoisomerase-1
MPPGQKAAENNGAMSAAEAVESARQAGLRYVADSMPGIRRKRAGRGFTYIGGRGRPVRDREELRRIKALAIPPAWTDVWICPLPEGHLQTTGRDVKGRKQYRYHQRWREVRDENKYERLLDFANALPIIREQTDRDMRRQGLPMEKVLATVTRLLESTLVRVGNEEYARENGSIGLTTMRNGHAHVSSTNLRFQFRGKGGKEIAVEVSDRCLARIVKRCQELPGQTLFQYVDDDGQRQSIQSEDVNDYLRQITGREFTAKDFRTWAGTFLAAQALRELDSCDSPTQRKKNVIRAIDSVAKELGNTRAICRSCYVHPAVLDAYMEGSTLRVRRWPVREANRSTDGLRPEEAAVLSVLRKRFGLQAGNKNCRRAGLPRSPRVCSPKVSRRERR